MTTTRDVTIWDLMSMVLWSALFAVGLVPELAFHGLRGLAHVSSRFAMVNSSAMITFGLSAYLMFFVARQCVLTRMSRGEAHGKAIHVGLLSILAFLEIPSQSPVFGIQTLLGLMLQSELQVEFSLKVMLWSIGCTKLAAWLYLYSLMIRFHIFGNREAFSRMPTFFVQIHREPKLEELKSTEGEISNPADEKLG